ncbi:MAG: TonB-dependent receptor [Syntrophaceae bacterium]|nr:TonB-dependent receptor [Syntrophaceae bacterium]
MKKILVLILFCSLVAVLPLSAQDQLSPENKNDEPAVKLQEIVVTATRDEQEIRKSPANVTVITAEEMEKSGATTVVETLQKLESVQFRSYSGNSSNAIIDVRGFGGENPYGKTLIMLDGRRLNRTDMSSINWLQMPVNNIDRIEIVRGPGSVLYGDAAIGGVINIITKKGHGKPVFNASIIGGSYGLHNERVGVTGATGKWTYALTGENNHIDGYRQRSEYTSMGGGFDLGYAAHDLFNISLGVSFNRNDYQLPGALTKLEMEQDRRQHQPGHDNDDNRDKFTNVNLGVKSFWGSWGRMEVNFLYGKKDLQSNMPSYWNPYYADTTSDTYSISPKYVLDKEIFGFGNKLVAGLDYYNEPYKKDLFHDHARASKYSDANLERESIGYYIRDEFSILKKLILSAGYRYERTNIEGTLNDIDKPSNDFDSEKTYTSQSYEAGLTWLWGNKSRSFVKYATVYRIPFLDEIAGFNSFGGGFLTTLEQEKGKSMEVGTEYYPLENLKLGLTLYQIDMEDEIEYVYTGTGYYNQNVGETRHQGVEAYFSYLWPQYFKVYGNFTYHRATYENGQNDGKKIPMVPQYLANAGLEIYLPFNIMLKPEVHYVSRAYLGGDSDNNTEKLDSYTLVDVYLQYKPTFGRLNMTVFAGVENLTDEKYSSYGFDQEQWFMPNAYYPMPGRTFKAGIKFEY